MSDTFLCAIEDFGQQSSEFLGIFDTGLTRLHTLRPFGASGVRYTHPVGGHVYAIAHLRGRSEDGTPIALFDAETGQELARSRSFILPESITHLPRAGMIAVIGGLGAIEFRDAQTLELGWTCRPLATIEPSGDVTPVPDQQTRSRLPQSAAHPEHILAEGPDGLVRMPFSCRNAVGVYEIDPKSRTWRVATMDPGPQDQGFNACFVTISPDGRWGLREAVMLDVEPCDRLQSDHGCWVLVTRRFELWDLPHARRQADIPLAPIPVLIYTHNEKVAFEYLDWLRAGDTPRGPFGLLGTKPKQPLPGHEQAPHKPRKDLIGEGMGDRTRFHWEPDSAGVWAVRRYSMMRAELDGSTGPLIFPDHGLGEAQRAILQDRPEGIDIGKGEAYPHGRGCSLIRSISKPRPDLVCFDFYNGVLDLPLPYGPKDAQAPARSMPKLTARDIEAKLPALIRVKAWTQEAVDMALSDLQARLEDGLEKLASGNGLTLIFKMRGKFLDEWAFFEQVQEKGMVNVPALRALLISWFDAQGDKQWYFNSDEERIAGPMSGALACLAQNDDACDDILRRYCLLRDGEHENFARDEVLLGYIERKGLRDVDALRLAIFFVFLREHDGRFSVEDGKVVYPWADLGIPQAARDLTSAADFVALLRGEIARFGGETARFDAPLRGLAETLDATLPWDAEVIAALPA